MNAVKENSPDPAIGDAVEACLGRLVAEDRWLFESGVNEPTISGRLAHYLQDYFPGYHVDPEYNRHGVKVKTANLLSGAKVVRPDVVVHRRGNDAHNLLVIELKLRGRGTADDRVHAHEKLAALVHGEYRYRYGLFLELGTDAQSQPVIVSLQWYVRDVD